MAKEIKIYHGVGRRKSAIARVSLVPGKGTIDVHSWTLPKENEKYVREPLVLTEKNKEYDISATIIGGGVSSRLTALRLGIARALIQADPELKTILRKSGLLTRDDREKERKKPGLRRARRAPQWAKR